MYMMNGIISPYGTGYPSLKYKNGSFFLVFFDEFKCAYAGWHYWRGTNDDGFDAQNILALSHASRNPFFSGDGSKVVFSKYCQYKAKFYVPPFHIHEVLAAIEKNDLKTVKELFKKIMETWEFQPLDTDPISFDVPEDDLPLDLPGVVPENPSFSEVSRGWSSIRVCTGTLAFAPIPPRPVIDFPSMTDEEFLNFDFQSLINETNKLV